MSVEFTPEELQRLLNLRQSLALRETPLEIGLDEKRLGFARYLVQHGYLSEGEEPYKPPTQLGSILRRNPKLNPNL